MIYNGKYIEKENPLTGLSEKIPILGQSYVKTFKKPIDMEKVLNWWENMEMLGYKIVGSKEVDHIWKDTIGFEYTMNMGLDFNYRVCECGTLYNVFDSDATMNNLFCSKACENGY